MLWVWLIISILLAVAFVILGQRVLFRRNGEFPNIHIGRDKNMRERGIGCATSQDREARVDNKYKIDVDNLN